MGYSEPIVRRQHTAAYAELHCISNFTFLRGASHPEELVQQADTLGYAAIAITDECSLAGVVKAYCQHRELRARGSTLKLIIGSEFSLHSGKHARPEKIVALAPTLTAYQDLSAFITLCRRRCNKGEYRVEDNDLLIHLKHCLVIYIPTEDDQADKLARLEALAQQPQLWVGFSRLCDGSDEHRYQLCYRIANQLDKPMIACGNVHMHSRQRKMLQDTLAAIRSGRSIQQMGENLQSNAEQYLRPPRKLAALYPEPLIAETLQVAERCKFSLDEIRYQYPDEIIPPQYTAARYLRELVQQGARKRWHNNVPIDIRESIEKELQLISELNYEYYFLTVHDIVSFARERGILCQGRGSAANSVVCYCLFITEVDPARAELLFERFISRERDEPPDIDVDFEHERREEVIQYIYRKYSRERAALAATIITYRTRSAIRDVGKALGFSEQFTLKLSKSLGWWHSRAELEQRLGEFGVELKAGNNASIFESGQPRGKDEVTPLIEHFIELVQQILGFPRHLSQHVGGFIISRGPLSRLVPVENASMPDRTVIQWDKESIEALGLLKIDVLGLGMLSAIRKTLALASQYLPRPIGLADIPDNDRATYAMLSRGDSIGVFQVESRAQISMLPRLKPREFYDLVIQVAIVRPGPIQGDMVHPYLRRREGTENVDYANDDIRRVLSRTLGVPIFQEQVIKLAMVAAGFTGGEADQLRRAMASWGKNGNLLQFKEKLVHGMQQRGYANEFAERVFNQMKGFGAYGFPESHAASFALLVYVSSWLKRHHTAAFYAGLINSQPMGFYSPSQLVQDARRHGVVVRPIDIHYSDWDCTLEAIQGQNRQHHALRLGMRLAKGLRQEAASRIASARRQRPFSDLGELVRRAKLNKDDRQVLVRAGALTSLSGHRHQSHWQNLAADWDDTPITRLEPSSASHSTRVKAHDHIMNLNDDINLPAPTEMQTIQADYNATGLTLNRHPMLLLRERSPFRYCKRCADLRHLDHGRYVQVAGIVTGRQRPGTASGVIFLTLEDETGNINVVVWRDLQQRYREPLLKSKLLLVKGVMERKDSVIHVIAGVLKNSSQHLEGLLLPSRDFH